jgi:arylsulfatase A-like enzyme
MRFTEENKSPNFLVIVADDLGTCASQKTEILIVGYSDTSPYGAEISTPAIQRLSDEGVRLTQFHTASACSPTRSMLLSGTDNHIAGLGQMFVSSIVSTDVFRAEFLGPLKGNPGYEGYLNDRVAALPAVLKEAGYATVISGKWHLGTTKEQCPSAKGFDKVFSLLQGGTFLTLTSANPGGNHYRIVLESTGPSIGKDAVFKNNYDVGKDEPFKTLAELPEDFYSSDYYANKLIDFLSESPKERPFFAYLPFTAPHWPLQAPPEITKKYKGKYDDGPAELRVRRLAAQVKLGLLDDGVEPYPLTGGKEWDEMTEDERKYSAKTMEVYAAMVESMDYNIGKVVKYLESTGQLDNTFIVFHSDNGAVLNP